MSKDTSTRPAFVKYDSGNLAGLDGRVISIEAIESRLTARRLLDEAQRTLDQAKLDAIAEREKGYQDGFVDGQREALKSTTAISLLVTDVVERWMGDSEQQLQALLIDSFEKLIGHTPDNEIVGSLVGEGLRAMGSGKGLVIKVADPMLDVAKESARHYAADADYDLEFSVVSDPTLTGTDVVVQTPLGVIDLRQASLKSQLSSMLQLD